MTENDTRKLSEAFQLIEEAASLLPPAELPAMIGTLERIKALAWPRLFSGRQPVNGAEPLLTIPQVAKRLTISKYRAYELVRQGAIRKTPVGDSVRVTPADLAAYLAH